jgi:hypothetical protein
MKHTINLLIAMSLLTLLSGCSSKEHADLIVYNAVVYTVDNDFSIAEAFAVKDGKFIAVGSSEEVLRRYQADARHRYRP